MRAFECQICQKRVNKKDVISHWETHDALLKNKFPVVKPAPRPKSKKKKVKKKKKAVKKEPIRVNS